MPIQAKCSSISNITNEEILADCQISEMRQLVEDPVTDAFVIQASLANWASTSSSTLQCTGSGTVSPVVASSTRGGRSTSVKAVDYGQLMNDGKSVVLPASESTSSGTESSSNVTPSPCILHSVNHVSGSMGNGIEYGCAEAEFMAFMVQAHELIKSSGLPNYMGCRIKIPSRFHIDYLERELRDYEDKEVLEFLKFGYPLGIVGQVAGRGVVSNHRSAVDHPEQMSKYVEEEVSDRAVIGGFATIPFSSDVVFSPLGSTEKRDSEDRRVIMDLSFPRGGSVNDAIPKDTYLGHQVNLTFPRIDELVELVRIKGQGCMLFKKDLRRAYRQIRVDVGQANYLGFTWEGLMYFDISLPMGLRSSALCCQRTTLCIQHIYKNQGFDLVVYLDDLGGAESPDKAGEAYECLGRILESAGLEEKKSKACPPSTRMSFLGVWFDTESLTLEITRDRLEELLELLEKWESRSSASRQELQSIIGKLNFVSSVVKPGRVFISRLLNH